MRSDEIFNQYAVTFDNPEVYLSEEKLSGLTKSVEQHLIDLGDGSGVVYLPKKGPKTTLGYIAPPDVTNQDVMDAVARALDPENGSAMVVQSNGSVWCYPGGPTKNNHWYDLWDFGYKFEQKQIQEKGGEKNEIIGRLLEYFHETNPEKYAEMQNAVKKAIKKRNK